MWKNKSPFRLAVNIASITLDVESRNSVSLVQHLAADMGISVSNMWESIEVLIQASLKTAKVPDGGPYPMYSSGKSWNEASVKTSSRQKFYHNAISGANSAAQPTLSQSSFQGSINAWVDWKLMKTPLSWDLIQRRLAV